MTVAGGVPEAVEEVAGTGGRQRDAGGGIPREERGAVGRGVDGSRSFFLAVDSLRQTAGLWINLAEVNVRLLL